MLPHLFKQFEREEKCALCFLKNRVTIWNSHGTDTDIASFKIDLNLTV